MGKHNAEDPAGFPADMWRNEDVRDAASAFWDGVVDYAEDGDLSDAGKDRMVRAGRTLAQGSVGAALITAALAWLPVDVPAEAVPAVMAALTAVLSWLHKRR